jgi:hypothetical protein
MHPCIHHNPYFVVAQYLNDTTQEDFSSNFVLGNFKMNKIQNMLMIRTIYGFSYFFGFAYKEEIIKGCGFNLVPYF